MSGYDLGGMVDVMRAAEADEAVRDDRRAAATAYLHRTGNADLLPILGLTKPPAKPARAPRTRYADRPAKTCPVCRRQFPYKRATTCSKDCGMAYRAQRQGVAQ